MKKIKIFKNVLIFLLLLPIIFLLIIFCYIWNDSKDPYQNYISSDKIPSYVQKKLKFTHNYESKLSLPVIGSTMIDIDNDNIDEIFLGGGLGQNDAIFKYENNVFKNITKDIGHKKSELLNSLAASSVDLDNNDFDDLIVSREDGVYIYYNFGTKFELKKLDIDSLGLNDKSTPLSLSFGDINKDGFLDFFLSTYISKESMNGLTNFSEGYGSTSVLMLNNGDNTFKNITKESGLDYVHNTFQGVFVDLDDDTNLDLVVAYDTGEPRVYKNNGDLTFSLKPNPYTNKYSYPMGVGIGDYNNDLKTDLFFSNIGSSLPKIMVKGDLPSIKNIYLKWMLLENQGNFDFIDVAPERKLADFEFSWGSVFTDLNNDGLQDLLVSENFVDLGFQEIFKLPGRVLLQKDDNTFAEVGKESSSTNPYFGITPMLSDFNLDGYQDIVWVNIGEPSIAYISLGLENDYIYIDATQNAKNIGAKIYLYLDSGRVLMQDIVIGEGLASDQGSLIHFGINKSENIEKIKIKYISSEEKTINKVQKNIILKI